MLPRGRPAPSPLCLAQAGQDACIARHHRHRGRPARGRRRDRSLDEAGTEVETQTTEADGKWTFQVTEAGTYVVKLDKTTLPEGLEQLPPTKALEGRRPLKVEVRLGRTAIPRPRGPSGGLQRLGQQGRRADPEHGQRPPARPAARARLGRPLPDLRHDRPLQLRPRRAGDARRHARLLPGQPSTASASGSAACWSLICAPSRAGSRTGCCGNRCDGAGLGLTQMMIVTIGLSLALQYVYQYPVGARTVRVTLRTIPSVRQIGPVTITNHRWSRWASRS